MIKIRREDPVYTWFVVSKNEYSKRYLTILFVLLNKYYKELGIYSFDEFVFDETISWEDLILNDSLELKDYPVDCEISLCFYTEDKNGLKLVKIENGLRFFFAETEGRFCLGIDIYANVFTDLNYDYIDRKYFEIDRSLSARKNREILNKFLKQLSDKLIVDRVDFSSDFIDYKYLKDDGICEDAILKYK